ncbi:tyrosine-type recombinase/integrase [Trinickia acidisoli]|uniref:tyrosine-type recombinase/integrase n=1 Tax=Trinickia acidisoli TaxID=2767482 RepID=UPI002852EB90|nr:tyrosine-type recombinase/integrase [Trinickia acidisoli]
MRRSLSTRWSAQCELQDDFRTDRCDRTAYLGSDGLTRSDVDFEKRLLHIRSAKFGKSRWVPIHPTTASAMRRYACKRDRDSSTANTNAFFVFDYGRPASTRSVEYAFKILRTALKWRARGDHPAPRIHDLRHSFVCHRLQDWYAQGVDVDRNILALSTYLGHAKVTDTYWYETASPELLAIAAQRFVRHRGGSS